MSSPSGGKGSGQPSGGENAPSDEVVEFIASLQEMPSGTTILFGMVMAAETTGGVMFAHPGDCARWVHIPAAAIHRVRHSGRIGCGAHSHAAAEIALKEPQSDLEKAFASIAGLHSDRNDALLQTGQAASASTQPCPPGFKWLPGPTGVYICRKYP